MTEVGLAKIPDVDIDQDGDFNYVLIEVHPSGIKNSPSKEIVRGYKWAEKHSDIYDKISGEMHKQGFDCKCLGGGKISHRSHDKKIHVNGQSQSFGRAQHSLSTLKLQAQYPNYEITWADDG